DRGDGDQSRSRARSSISLCRVIRTARPDREGDARVGGNVGGACSRRRLTGRYAPRQTHHRSARFQVTVPTPPLDAVGVTYLSSSPFAVTISLFCVVPFQLGNVAAST